jgi:acyl transferase domain-containing protein/acyl carrier protein
MDLLDVPSNCVAIVGMSGRFPGAQSIDEYWTLLSLGKEAIRSFSQEELLQHGTSVEDITDPNFVACASLMDNPDLFDAAFFGMSPREASVTDPQQRIMLEVSHEALDHAGYGEPSRRPRTGVFVGSSLAHYAFNIYSHGDIKGGTDSLQSFFGNGESHLATRISYKLNLHGPSMYIQTACSTSLVALHMARTSLLLHESDMALAGGVSITAPFPCGYPYREGSILSPDGHCRPFDSDARGTVIGNGAGVLVMRRLEDALEYGDTIYAIVRGSAINNDGSAKVGYTAPSQHWQEQVLAEALAVANISPSTVTMMEAHGTGTTLGDPIEMASLNKIYKDSEWRHGRCLIGSVKSNIGHLLAASGVAGIIKAVLALKEGKIPPSINFKTPNPAIDFKNSPFQVATELTEWNPHECPRRAAVSSFGIGGTNAHVILEQAPEYPPSDKDSATQLLTLSAKTPSALHQNALNLAEQLRSDVSINLADVAYILQIGREDYGYRWTAVCNGIDDAVTLLSNPQIPKLRVVERGPCDIAIVFPGQGVQRVNMFDELYKTESVFRKHMLECADVLLNEDIDIIGVLYGKDNQGERRSRSLKQTLFAQPVLFATEYSLAKLWMNKGIRPNAILGHSLGELTAACLANVMSLKDALELVVTRARLMQSQPPGAMLAASMPESQAAQYVNSTIELAAVNGPNDCVFTGTEESITTLSTRLQQQDVHCAQLEVSHAFHSRAMEPAVLPLVEKAASIELKPAEIPFISNVTGTWITDEQATDAQYWGRQMRETVRFADGVKTLERNDPAVYLEVGPGKSLSRLVQKIVSNKPVLPTVMGSSVTADCDSAFLLSTLGRIWAAGVEIKWECLHESKRRLRVALPAYSYERERFWISERRMTQDGEKGNTLVSQQPAAVREKIADWFYVPAWRRAFNDINLELAAELNGKKTWLLFVIGEPVGTNIEQRLRALGQRVVTVRPEMSLSINVTDGNGEASLRPLESDDYEVLMESVVSPENPLSYVLYLWSLGDLPEIWSPTELYFHAPVLLAKALSRCEQEAKISLTFYTDGVQTVASESVSNPFKALTLGPAKVIDQELPGVSSRHVDIQHNEWSSPGEVDKLIHEALGVEGATLDKRERDLPNIIALRGSRRWIQTYQATPLAPASIENNHLLKDQGVYLITGGLGGIGFVVAEYLARELKARLILTTRAAFPEKNQWARLLSDPHCRDKQKQQIANIQQLESYGAQVMIGHADVADLFAMRAVVRTASNVFGNIDGVIHAAGIAGGGMLQLKSFDAAEQVIKSKVNGTIILEEALDDVNPKFMILCSSLASIRGGFGQIDYCAANAFLDAYAHCRVNNPDRLTLSINWGAWAEVGMAVEAMKRYGFLPCPFWLTHSQADSSDLDHPFLNNIVKNEEGQLAVRCLDDSHNLWVLNEHKVHGKPTMPGTGIIELIRSAWHAINEVESENSVVEPKIVELRNIQFLKPVSVQNSQEEAVFCRIEVTNNITTVHVGTRQAGEYGLSTLLENSKAEIAYADDNGTDYLDIDNIKKRLIERKLTPSSQQVGHLEFGPRWDVLTHLWSGDLEVFAELALTEQFASDTELIKVHPALLDVALGVAKYCITTTDSYLPLSYGKVKIIDHFPTRICCWARHKESKNDQQTTLCFDATITDPQGCIIMEVEDYILKKLDSTASQDNEKDRQKTSNVSDALKGAIRSIEGVDALTRAMVCEEPQIVISPLNLDAVIDKWRTDAKDLIQQIGNTKLSKRVGDSSLDNEDYETPINFLEKEIAKIWTELLGVVRVDRSVSFFELGGDSLLGINLQTRLNDMYQVKLSLNTVFETPTVSALAKEIEAMQLEANVFNDPDNNAFEVAEAEEGGVI